MEICPNTSPVAAKVASPRAAVRAHTIGLSNWFADVEREISAAWSWPKRATPAEDQHSPPLTATGLMIGRGALLR
jgi:hypothetical protein